MWGTNNFRRKNELPNPTFISYSLILDYHIEYLKWPLSCIILCNTIYGCSSDKYARKQHICQRFRIPPAHIMCHIFKIHSRPRRGGARPFYQCAMHTGRYKAFFRPTDRPIACITRRPCSGSGRPPRRGCDRRAALFELQRQRSTAINARHERLSGAV